MIQQVLIDFALPAACVVCGKLPKPICESCSPIPISGIENFAGRPLFFAAELEGVVEDLIRNYKDKSRLVLERPLRQLLEHSILQAQTLNFDCFAQPPRNSRNFRKRGFDPLARLTRRTSLRLYEKLKVSSQRKLWDQRKLSYVERQRNLLEAFTVEQGHGRVLLVDDVVTSGATLRELKRACEQAGYEVVGFCVIARRFGLAV